MRFLAKALLVLNGILLAFIVLWLLVGGGNRGYFGGGAATEVDGVLLLFLAMFNLVYLSVVFFVFSQAADEKTTNLAKGELGSGADVSMNGLRSFLRSCSVYGLTTNGVLILFLALWLMISSGRRSYFQANATEVDILLLLFLSILNIGYMALTYLKFSARSANKEIIR